MFVCPICKKQFENLDDYAKHISGENATDKKAKQQAADDEKKKLADKIEAKYSELKKLIAEFNKKYDKEYYASELKHVNKRDKRDIKGSSFPEFSSEPDDDLATLFCKALFGDDQ